MQGVPSPSRTLGSRRVARFGAVYDAAAALALRPGAALDRADQEIAVPDQPDRPTPLDALAVGVAAAIHGADLDEGVGTLVGAAVAALGATSAMVSLQDPDRQDPELTLT